MLTGSGNQVRILNDEVTVRGSTILVVRLPAGR